MRILKKAIYTCFVTHLYLLAHTSYGQIIAGSFDPEVDTSYVDLQYDNWSLRLLGTYKHQNLLFTNSNGETVRYMPNDQNSVGVGFSYKYLIIDINVRLLLNRQEFTSRFDLQGEVVLQKHLVDIFVQRYKGFNKTNHLDQTVFRDDMRSWIVGMNYLYNFNHKKISVRSVITGNRQQKQAAGTFLLGGFFSVQDLEADTLLITPDDGNFNKYAQIQNSELTNLGIMGGYAFVTPISKHLFFLGGLMPGAGLNFGKVNGHSSYSLKLSPMAKVNTRAAFAYIGARWYGGIHYSSDYFLINLNHNNLFRYNIGKFKLVIGYKFDANNTIIEDILGE